MSRRLAGISAGVLSAIVLISGCMDTPTSNAEPAVARFSEQSSPGGGAVSEGELFGGTTTAESDSAAAERGVLIGSGH